ncbi:MAG: hypothetical protein QOG10_6163 [Kribbellaceae bacterium]|nr:hypothetical protein [Kribbellaceae bacterium]
MGDNKMLPILGGVFLFLLLPLLIVIAMVAASLAAIGGDGQCVPTTGAAVGKSFGYPTKEHGIEQGWDAADPKHTGLDYKVAAGTAVLAAADGQVVSVDGDWIKIQHNDGVQTWYEFFQSKKVHVGDKVKRGDEIGKSGSGAESQPGISGDHLHFELRVQMNGNQLDPVDPTDQVGDAASDPNSGGCGCGNGSGGPLVGTNNQQKAFNFFASNGYSKEQAAGIVGNMIHESGVEPARKQDTPPGSVTHPSDVVGSAGGWGIVQWTPAGKMITPSKRQGADDKTIESLEFQLSFLKQQLDGTGPVPEGGAGQQLKKAKTVEEAAVAFGRYFERFAGKDDLSNPKYAERKTAATQVLDTFGGGAPGGAAGGGGCAGNGDISATAVMLAWPEPGHGKYQSDAKKEYQDAMPKYNGATTEDPYSDCGVFVATVMRMSGADPKYPLRGTGVQEAYLRSSGKYDILDIPVQQLKPGDIMIGPGHTFLIIDPQAGGYSAASASLHGHVPEFGHAYTDDNGKHFVAARLKS